MLDVHKAMMLKKLKISKKLFGLRFKQQLKAVLRKSLGKKPKREQTQKNYWTQNTIYI